MIDKTALIHHNYSVERYAKLKTVPSNIDYSAGVELGPIIPWRCGFKSINGYRGFKTEYGISNNIILGMLIVSFNQYSNYNNVIFRRLDHPSPCWVGRLGVVL